MKSVKIKSQVTMLMIVGLVIFITISLVLYLYKSTIKKYSQQAIKKTQEASFDSQTIKQFVTKCLDKLAKDAIILLGRQGGYIYTSQGGTLIDYNDVDEGIFFVKYNGHNVAYNILPPKFAPQAPIYPWESFPYETDTSNTEIFEGYFGTNNIPPLYSYEGQHSIQTQIETFVDNQISSCANISLFESQGYDAELLGSKTQVTIGSTDVSVNSIIPLKITNTATKETSEMKYFSTKLDIRLKDIYYFIIRLTDHDTKNIKFNLSDARNNEDDFSIRVIKNIIYTNSKSDLVVVTDKKSLIYGKPFEYTFARKNRAPALYYLRPNTLAFPYGYLINKTDLLQNKPLKAEDSDEDDYKFKIFMGESGDVEAQFPIVLNQDQIKFIIEVNDGALSDYQVINVVRI